MALEEKVRRTQEDAKVMFDMIHAALTPHVKDTVPEPTGIVLALIDLLVIWSIAVKAGREDIIEGINMCWDNAVQGQRINTPNSKPMDKHVN